jgi:hypothetical protein
MTSYGELLTLLEAVGDSVYTSVLDKWAEMQPQIRATGKDPYPTNFLNAIVADMKSYVPPPELAGYYEAACKRIHLSDL